MALYQGVRAIAKTTLISLSKRIQRYFFPVSQQMFGIAAFSHARNSRALGIRLSFSRPLLRAGGAGEIYHSLWASGPL